MELITDHRTTRRSDEEDRRSTGRTLPHDPTGGRRTSIYSDAFLEKFGVTVDVNEMLSVPARIFPAIGIK